ncbi:MAG: OB-fold nucleic acid binding domain-containing protein, partial [Ktedonobacterales bacterium]
MTTIRPCVHARATELEQHAGERVQVCGWLHAIRRLGGVSFLIIRDGSGLAQAVATTPAELAPLTESGAGVESVITVAGRVERAEQAPSGYELREPAITIIAPVTEALPVTLNKRELKA